MHSYQLLIASFSFVGVANCLKAGNLPFAFVHNNLTFGSLERRRPQLIKRNHATPFISSEEQPLQNKYEPSEEQPEIIHKNLITTNSTIILPFPAAVAFDAFSDVTRQPSWSPWLHSVSYVENEIYPESETDWKMKLLGFKYSWRAINTRLVRPYVIEWKSTSGLRNGGKVLFEPIFSESGEDGHCKMTMSMNFIAPRPIILLFPNKIESIFREIILKRTLSQFREIVAAENVT